MLVRIDPRKRPEDFGEMELLRVRGSFPDQTLYTLQVEVWSDFGTGELSAAQVRARAEEACARLRREGWTAYVHHEVDRVISSVTVGLYDNRSIDAESGLDLDAALIRARKRFPHHLVNGEELQEPIDPRRPALGTRRQAPQLVEAVRLVFNDSFGCSLGECLSRKSPECMIFRVIFRPPDCRRTLAKPSNFRHPGNTLESGKLLHSHSRVPRSLLHSSTDPGTRCDMIGREGNKQ